MGVERAAEDAAARGLDVEFLTREGTGRPTAADFGGAPIVKTIVVQRGETFVLVLTPLDVSLAEGFVRAYGAAVVDLGVEHGDVK